MTPNDFCYWLQGFFEVTDAKIVTPEQVEVIKEHLQLVFNKVTSPSKNVKLPVTWYTGNKEPINNLEEPKQSPLLSNFNHPVSC